MNTELKYIMNEQEGPVNRRHPFNFHKCNSCAFRTKSLRVILLHLRKHEVESARFSCQTGTLEAFECQFCYFEHNLKIVVDRHESLVHGGQCPDPELEFKGYVCDKCDFETHSLLVFARHVCDDSQIKLPVLRKKTKPKRRIVSDKWFKCEQCTFKTKNNKNNLKVHIFVKHTDPNKARLFECGQCHYKAKMKNHLKQHILAKHSNPNRVKWFQCEQCLYKAKFKGLLKRHVLARHAKPDEVRNFECAQCSYKTKLNCDLKKHTYLVHSNPNELKWFECGKCCFKSKTKTDLNKHILLKHTDADKIEWVKCDRCSFKTKMKTCLKKHVATKHEIKWLKCEHCSYKAKLAEYLKLHVIRKHLNDDDVKWFECKLCSYRAKVKHVLKKHLYNNHTRAKNMVPKYGLKQHVLKHHHVVLSKSKSE